MGLLSPLASPLLWGLFLFSTHSQGVPGPPTSGIIRAALPDPVGILDGQLTHDETVPARHEALGSNRAVVGRLTLVPTDSLRLHPKPAHYKSAAFFSADRECRCDPSTCPPATHKRRVAGWAGEEEWRVCAVYSPPPSESEVSLHCRRSQCVPSTERRLNVVSVALFPGSIWLGHFPRAHQVVSGGGD